MIQKTVRFLALGLVLLMPFMARAGEPPSVDRIEQYLRALVTVQADFIQNSEGAPTARGIFYLNRPGRMRFAYQEPAHSFLVADGTFVYFWDAPQKQVSQTTIGATLADFLLREDLRLSGDVTVTGITPIDDQIQLTLQLTKDPSLGNITLRFQQQPLMILGWRVVDAQGTISDVSLTNLQSGVKLDKKLFYFARPGFGDKSQIDY